MAHARTEAGRELLQFRSRAAAHQYLPLYELCRRHVARGAAILDWGAGNAHFSYFLRESGYRVTNFRLGETDADRWLEYRGIERVIGAPDEVRSLPFPDRSFDAVCSVGVLEHVEDAGGRFEDSLRELWRVTARTGHLVIFHLPSSGSWIEAVARRLPDTHAHSHPFARAEIERLLVEAGWHVLELERYGLLPRNVLGTGSRAWADSPRFSAAWDRIDRLAGRFMAPLCQNFAVVAQKRDRSEER